MKRMMKMMQKSLLDEDEDDVKTERYKALGNSFQVDTVGIKFIWEKDGMTSNVFKHIVAP